jgi:UDPglucose 6-dehydrogenase
MPGSIEKSFIPLIQSTSGRVLNEGFGIGYDPDFVALGNVIKGFLEPDLVVIGESDETAGRKIEEIHSKLCINNPTVTRMSLISAEIAKVCLNVYITMKISFANVIANLCEEIPGSDPDHITQALGSDRRISPYYFKGGLSIGGTCLNRDLQVFKTLMKKYDLFPKLMEVIEDINTCQNTHLFQTVLIESTKQGFSRVGILGLSFVPNSPVIIESPGLKLLQYLLSCKAPVTVYDPHALPNVRSQFENSVIYAFSAEECVSESDVVVVMHRSEEFRKVVEEHEYDHETTIIDCWRIIDPSKIKGSVKYVPLGKSYMKIS